MRTIELFNYLSKAKDDNELWSRVLKYKKSVKLLLDNDCTFIEVKGLPEEAVTFFSYLGNSDGVVALLKAIGIDCEQV